MSDTGTTTTTTTTAPEFLAMLPDDIRADVGFKDFAKAATPAEAVGNLARSYLGQAKLLGGPREQLVQLPLASEDAKAWEPVWNRLGRPESADKYQLTDPAELPQGLAVNPERKTQFMTEAHALGLSQKQADRVWQSRNQSMIDGYKGALAELGKAVAAVDTQLKSEWGSEFDAKTADATAAIAHFAAQFKLGDALQQAVDATPGANGVAVRKVFAELGRQMKADKVIGGGGAGTDAKGMAQAIAERAQLYNDAEFMKQYRNPDRSVRQPAIARMLALNEIIAAGGASEAA